MKRVLDKLSVSPAYVAVFVLFLAVVQLRGVVLQFRDGYRPFLHEPAREAFAWDMFATRIERCDLRWASPVPGPKGDVTSLAHMTPRLEWALVFDEAKDYAAYGKWACRTMVGNKVLLHCFFPDGTESRSEVPCE